MKARVAPREPVEPATITGCAGGAHGPGRGQRLGGGAHPALAARRAGGGEHSRRSASRKRRLRCQCAACSAGVDARRTPRAARPRLASRRGDRRGCRRGRRRRCRRRAPARRRQARATSRASSSLRRSAGTGGGRSSGAERVVGELGDHADPRQEPRRPLGEGGGERRWARRVLTQISTRATASGGWPASRASSPATSAREKSTPGGSAKTRGPLGAAAKSVIGRARPRPARCPRAGRRRPSRPGWTTPPSRPSAISASQTGLSEKTRRARRRRGGVDDLRAGIDRRRAARGRARRREPASASRKKSPAPACPTAAARGTRQSSAPIARPPGGGERERAGSARARPCRRSG